MSLGQKSGFFTVLPQRDWNFIDSSVSELTEAFEDDLDEDITSIDYRSFDREHLIDFLDSMRKVARSEADYISKDLSPLLVDKESGSKELKSRLLSFRRISAGLSTIIRKLERR